VPRRAGKLSECRQPAFQIGALDAVRRMYVSTTAVYLLLLLLVTALDAHSGAHSNTISVLLPTVPQTRMLRMSVSPSVLLRWSSHPLPHRSRGEQLYTFGPTSTKTCSICQPF
jgi:hypothetical protein